MTTEQKIVKNKLGHLDLAQTLRNVAEACPVIGYLRESFYRFKELYETGGELTLHWSLSSFYRTVQRENYR